MIFYQPVGVMAMSTASGVGECGMILLPALSDMQSIGLLPEQCYCVYSCDAQEHCFGNINSKLVLSEVLNLRFTKKI